MATIGLDKLFYAKITEGENGEETYDKPKSLAKAMSAELSVELAEATLYADDGAAEVVKEFQSGTLSLGVADIGSAVAEDLTGAKIDDNKVLVSASEDALSLRENAAAHLLRSVSVLRKQTESTSTRCRKESQQSRRMDAPTQRLSQLLLAVSCKIRYSRYQPYHQGRKYRVFHAYY